MKTVALMKIVYCGRTAHKDCIEIGAWKILDRDF